MNDLNEIRQDDTEHTQNRLDTTLADVFSLLSLFFLTIGRTKECPAIYCQIASMRVSAHMWLCTIGLRATTNWVLAASAPFEIECGQGWRRVFPAGPILPQG